MKMGHKKFISITLVLIIILQIMPAVPIAMAQDFTIVSITPAWAQLGSVDREFEITGTGLGTDMTVTVEGHGQGQVFFASSEGDKLRFRITLSDDGGDIGGNKRVILTRGEVSREIFVNLVAVTDIYRDNLPQPEMRRGSTTGAYPVVVEGFGFSTLYGIEVYFEFPDRTIRIPDELIQLIDSTKFVITKMPEYSIPNTSFDIVVKNKGPVGEEFRLIKQQNRFTYTYSQPTIDEDSISIKKISRYGGTRIVFEGTQISRNAVIEFDGIAATSKTIYDLGDERFRVDVISPYLGITGNVNVVITNPDSQSTSFVVEAIETPYIEIVSPTYVRRGEEGKEIYLIGTNFGNQDNMELFIDNMDIPLTSEVGQFMYITSWTASEIRVFVDSINYDFGNKIVDIRIREKASPDVAFTKRNALSFLAAQSEPKIHNILPNIIPDYGNTTIEIHGEYFIGDVQVRFSNSSNPFDYFILSGENVLVMDATRLRVNIPEFTEKRVGFYHVAVINFDGGTHTMLNGILFKENVIRIAQDGIIPNIGTVEGGTLVAIQGFNFPYPLGANEELYITIGNRLAPSDSIQIYSTNLMTFMTPPGDGVNDLVLTYITEINGRSYTERTTVTNGYTYIEPVGPPEIALITPEFGPLVGGTPVTIEGYNFRSNTKVYFAPQKTDGTPDYANMVQMTHNPPSIVAIEGEGENRRVRSAINFLTPQWTKTGQVFVIVRNPSSIGNYDDMVLFTYVTTISALFNVNPQQGPFTGGNIVEIIGANLEYITQIFFGDRKATYINLNNTEHQQMLTEAGYQIPESNPSNTRIYVIAPANIPGYVRIRGYDDLLQMIEMPINYRYLYLNPEVDSISPLYIPGTGGTQMTIWGNEIHPGATVHYRNKGETQWQQVPQGNITSITNNRIEFIAPPGSRGLKEFSVKNPYSDNIFVKAPQEVYYISVPSVTSHKPSNIPRFAGDTGGLTIPLTVNGANFVNQYNLSNIQATIRKSDSSTERPLEIEFINNNQVLLYIKQTSEDKLDLGEHIIKIINPDAMDLNDDGQLDAGFVEFPINVTAATINPEIISIEPNVGPHTGGLDVVIKGNGFMINPDEKDMSKQRIKVFFGGREAEIIQVGFTTQGDQIIVRIPANTPGFKDVTITNMSPTAPDRIVGAYTKLNGFEYLEAVSEPIIYNIMPTKGSLEGGYPLVITGNGFLRRMHGLPGNNLRVFLGTREIPQNKILHILDGSGNEVPFDPPGRIGTKIIIEVPPGTIDMYNKKQDIIVLNPDTGIYRLREAFYYAPDILTPNIHSVVPSSGPITGNILINIYGQNFDAQKGVRVWFGDSEAQVINVTSENITVILPPADETLVTDVRVENIDGGTDIEFGIFTYFISRDPAPVIHRLVPDRGSIYGSGDNRITLYGQYLLSDDMDIEDLKLYIGSREINLEAGFVHKDKIEFKVPPITQVWGAKPGIPLTVTFMNSNGVAQTEYTYTDYDEDPTIISIQPDSGITDGKTPVTITGIGFKEGAKVYFGYREGTDIRVIDTSKLYVLSPPGEPGKVNVTVVNPDGGHFTVVDGYTYFIFDGEFPEIHSITPRRGRHTGHTPVTINGNNFMQGIRVFVGGVEAITTEFVSNQQIRITTPPGKIGKADITVLNPDGGVYTVKDIYEYVDLGNPNISKVEPNEGPAAGGIPVKIIGNNFDLGARVFFGNEEATNVVVVSETEITATLPENDLGKVDVIVRHLDGVEAVLKDGFTYAGVPRVPSNLTIRRLDDFTAEITWNLSKGARYYQIYIREQNQDEKFLATNENGKYILRNLKPQTYYVVSINSVNVDGSSARVFAGYYNGPAQTLPPDTRVDYSKNIVQVNQNSINITLGEESIYLNRNIFDFTEQQPANIKTISVPSKFTRLNNFVQFIDRDIEFTGFLGAMNVNGIDRAEKGFSTLRIEKILGIQRDNILRTLPRNVRPISQTFEISLNTLVNGQQTKAAAFARPVTLWFVIPNLNREERIFVYRYNETTRTWEKNTPNNVTERHVMLMTDKTGVFIIGQER